MSVHRVFAIELDADVELPGATAPNSDVVREPRVALRHASQLEPTPSAAPLMWGAWIDGRPLAVRDRGDGFAVAWGEDCRFVLDRSGRTLRWTGADPADAAWQRLVLDTVAYLAALVLGREALHAAAVRVDGVTLALSAPSGMGKSTLAAALLDAGAELVTDDVLAIEVRGDEALAHPGPPLMNVPVDHPLPERPVLASFGAELWTQVPVVAEPQALSGLVILERGACAPERVEPLEPSLLSWLPRMLAFPRTREREARRFGLAADLAERVPVRRLVADAATAPATLAERVLELAVRLGQPSLIAADA